MTDLHAKNGFLLRHRPLDEQVSELEMVFPGHERRQAVAIALALTYLALRARGIPYVASDATLRSFAVRTEDLGEATRQAFAEAVARVEREMARLLADAEIYFFDHDDKGVLETDPRGQLVAYRRAEVLGKRFLERFAGSPTTSS
jgi:hypothetical protein